MSLLKFSQLFLVLTSVALLPTHLNADSSSYTAAPPFVATQVGDPNVVIALDISGSMKAVAYRDTEAGGWQSGLHNDFDPNNKYFGYFESDKKYSYDNAPEKGFFYEDTNGSWDGKFLNWLTMRRMDVVRKVLVGGKVLDRSGTNISGTTWYIVEGQNEPADFTFRKAYNQSSTVSPINDGAEILISEGEFSQVSGNNASIVPLSDKVEIGNVQISRSISNDGWFDVKFLNTYSIPPAVVATGLSYNGSHQALTRVTDITTTGFKVRIDEWDYLDGNHTTETVTFIVAARGQHTISIKDSPSGTAQDYKVHADAGLLSGGVTGSISASIQRSDGVIFVGVGSDNDPTPVTARIHPTNVNLQVDIELQEQEANSSSHRQELISWIAMEKVQGYSGYAPSADTPIHIGDQTGHTHTWKNVNFPSGLFSKTPIIGAAMQTAFGGDTAVVRYGNSKWSKSGFDVRIEEEASSDSELNHTGESIGYIAVEHNNRFKIRLGLTAEPKGIIQQNATSIRFGLAVYNYDHSKDPTSIYNGNTVHGGTFRACYPDTNKAVSSRTNYDICLDTHVKSPLNNVIDVIEDHPLIWGTTPIAETLYDIKGYFSQEDFNRGSNSHNQWYDNGTEGTAKELNSYEISDTWDPYYYDEFSTRLPCAKSFVLHFNDGAPYRDFDGSGHPTVADDGVGNFGPQQMLDDLALELRENDCRTDNGMTGHQEIISYYVYAALGENEALNDSSRRMREAAANGGFVDDDGDNHPDPAHPADFNTYVSSGVCTPNEWDANGDCNPDTFYFANDAEELVNQLNAAFESITSRAGSGGSASVIAASRSGEGAVFNAIFRPSATVAGNEVTWIGDVHALMIDSAGDLRQDDGDKILEDPAQDNYIDMCSFNDGSTQEVRVKFSLSEAQRPTPAQTQTCSASIFSKDLFNIDYLWSGATWLSAIADSDLEANRSYAGGTAGRYIMTGIDINNDGMVDQSESRHFVPTSFGENYSGLIDGTESDAESVINFIRGIDQPGMRSRMLDGKTMRLGDIIYSTPTVVGRPAENFDLIYGSSSYQAFFNHYKSRRQVIYAGGNDGLLHAFNGGWYDSTLRKFLDNPPGANADFDLGQEIWAYSPYNTLNHLKYLTRPSYGAAASDHLYFVDLKPRIFDAKVFADDNDHPDGWGTIMVVGSRLGGGDANVDAHVNGGDNRILRSSYSIFDITNPDSPPRLLLEFSHPELGFTTAIPTPIFKGDNDEGTGSWYLLLGSGADTTPSGFDEVKSTRNAKLFLLDLNVIAQSGNLSSYNDALVSTFGNSGIYTLPDANSFISDLTAVDHDLDGFSTDAIYFGTVSGDNAGWGGKVYRIAIQENSNAQKAVNTWQPTVIYNPQRPVTAPVSTTVDSRLNHWLHVGTGRFYTQEDNLDTSINYFFGFKEPRSTTGEFSYQTIAQQDLVDVTNVEVIHNTTELFNKPTLTPPLPDGATITMLEQRFKRYNSTNEYVDGWVREKQNGERNFGAATIFGGTLTYTTFKPEFDECSIQGDSSLYILNVLTGTAGGRAILADDTNDPYNTYKVDLGNSPATSPSIHVGEGYTSDNKTNVIIQTSDGSITTIEQTNQNKVQSGEMSWRQLQ